MTAIINGLYFLISIAFYFVGLLLMFRLLVPLFNVDRRNPTVVSLMGVTDGLVAYTKDIPNYQQLETGTLLALWVLTMLKIFLLQIFAFGGVNLLGIPFVAIFDVVSVALDIFFFSIILVVVNGFFPSEQLARVSAIANCFAEPILTPLAAHLPKLGAVDVSPFVALVVIKLLEIVVINPFV